MRITLIWVKNCSTCGCARQFPAARKLPEIRARRQGSGRMRIRLHPQPHDPHFSATRRAHGGDCGVRGWPARPTMTQLRENRATRIGASAIALTCTLALSPSTLAAPQTEQDFDNIEGSFVQLATFPVRPMLI